MCIELHMCSQVLCHTEARTLRLKEETHRDKMIERVEKAEKWPLS